LRARIAAGEEPEVPATPSPAGVAALLMLAAALAFVIHERTSRPTDNLVPLAAKRPSATHNGPMIVVNPSAPFVTFTDLEVPAFSGPSEHYPYQVPIDTWANLPR